MRVERTVGKDSGKTMGTDDGFFEGETKGGGKNPIFYLNVILT